MVNTRIYAGSLLVLNVLANVRPAVSVPSVRPGEVLETSQGPYVQYGPAADTDEAIEVEIPTAGQAEIDTVRAMARGDYGDVFRIEGARETVQRAALLPGRDGVAIEVWPGDPASVQARVVLRFVRV